MEDLSSNGSGVWVRWILGALLTVLLVVLTAWQSNASRLAQVETKQQTLDCQFQYLRSDIRALSEKMDRNFEALQRAR